MLSILWTILIHQKKSVGTKKSKLNLTYANSKDFEISQFEKQYFSYTLGFLFVIVLIIDVLIWIFVRIRMSR